MSADDQQFLDVLSSLPNQIRRYSTDVALYFDRAVDDAAETIRGALATASWVPEYIRPRLSTRPQPIEAVPVSTYDRVQGWVVRHKVLSGVLLVTISYVTYQTVRKTRLLRKSRRAKRARNGGRLEVVVIAGSPALPLTKSLSLDMERRGFIVYIVCNTIEDEVVVQNLSRPDIKPLTIDITDPPSASSSIQRFASFLQTPHAAVPRAKANFLSFTSVILIPSLNYQTSPIATIPPSSFADLFNTHLLQPILNIQSFLPLLTSRLTPIGEAPTTPKVLVFTPSIICSINPPFHAPEATVCSALTAFTEVLTAELKPLGIPVTHVQLGTFDFAGFVPTRSSPSPGHQPGLLPSAETISWSQTARHTYGRNYTAQCSSAIGTGRIGSLRGSSLRELHNAVFDVIDGTETSGVVRVGLGAGLYGFVGQWAPRSLVSWMMGIRKVDELSTWSDSTDASLAGSTSGSEKDESAPGSDVGMGESAEFISVGRDEESSVSANVWREG